MEAGVTGFESHVSRMMDIGFLEMLITKAFRRMYMVASQKICPYGMKFVHSFPLPEMRDDV
jgi:hypothetical protein